MKHFYLPILMAVLCAGPVSAQEGQNITAKMAGATVYYETAWGGNTAIYHLGGVYSVSHRSPTGQMNTSKGKWWFERSSGYLCNDLGYDFKADKKVDRCGPFFFHNGKYYAYNLINGSLKPARPIKTIKFAR